VVSFKRRSLFEIELGRTRAEFLKPPGVTGSRPSRVRPRPQQHDRADSGKHENIEIHLFFLTCAHANGNVCVPPVADVQRRAPETLPSRLPISKLGVRFPPIADINC
jgi:hypothetical protein